MARELGDLTRDPLPLCPFRYGFLCPFCHPDSNTILLFCCNGLGGDIWRKDLSGIEDVLRVKELFQLFHDLQGGVV